MAKKGKSKAKRVLIVNNGTSYMTELHSQVKKHAAGKADIDTVNIRDIESKDVSQYDAIILSGSHKRKYDDPNLKYVIDKSQGTVVGICHGHQALAHYYGGKVEDLGTYQRGKKKIQTKAGESTIFKNHRYAVTDPGRLEVLAESTAKNAQGNDKRIIEMLKHPTKPHYGIQGHPEKGGHAQQSLYAILDGVYKK